MRFIVLIEVLFLSLIVWMSVLVCVCECVCVFVYSRFKVVCKFGVFIKVSEEVFKGCGEGSDIVSLVFKFRCLFVIEDKFYVIFGFC